MKSIKNIIANDEHLTLVYQTDGNVRIIHENDKQELVLPSYVNDKYFYKPKKSHSGKTDRKTLSDGTINPDYVHRSHGARGDKLSLFERANFIAWDGEGRNTGVMIDEGTTEHIYTLLANSLGDTIYNENGLSSKDCLNLICDCAIKNKKAIHVIYGASYDMNMILRDIPLEKLQEIASGTKSVYWQGYALTYAQRKYLKISRFKDPKHKFVKNSKGKYAPDYDANVTVWDVIGFFQGTFLNTIKKWLGNDAPDLLLIEEGKALRNKFDADNIDFIMKYNSAELRLLVTLMESLQKHLTVLGLSLSRWDGAGAVASAMFKKHEVAKAFKHKDGGKWIRDELPKDVQTCAQYAYFGGRIELGKYGVHEGTIYHYDIASAYPSAQWDLPALNKGTWRKVNHVKMDTLNKFSVIHVKWNLPDLLFCPFPFRAQSLQGKILYPTTGEGWLWYPEVKACADWLKTDKGKTYNKNGLTLIEAYEFIPSDDCYMPYAWMRDYYYKRQELVNDTRETGTPHGEEKIIKLGLNSCYGKTAQHVGYKTGSYQLPPYHNLAYAGYITSVTRAKLWYATTLNESAIICLATDGVFSTAPLDLDVSPVKELGKWDYETHDSMIILMSGFYWLKNEGKWAGWSRGFDKLVGEGETDVERKTDYQRKMVEQIDAIKLKWKDNTNVVYFPCTRFITLKTGTQNEQWHKRYCSWYKLGMVNGVNGRACQIVPDGTKRLTAPFDKDKKAYKEMVRTIPEFNYYPELGDMYALPWDTDFINLKERDDSSTDLIIDEENMVAMEIYD